MRFNKCTESHNHDHNQDSEQFNTLPQDVLRLHFIVRNNWCFWTVVLEKILESPLDCKEIRPVHPKGDQKKKKQKNGDQSWVLTGGTNVEAETPTFWPPDEKSWLIWKDLDAGKDWGQEEKGMTEDEMVDWHHWHDGHKFG